MLALTGCSSFCPFPSEQVRSLRSPHSFDLVQSDQALGLHTSQWERLPHL